MKLGSHIQRLPTWPKFVRPQSGSSCGIRKKSSHCNRRDGRAERRVREGSGSPDPEPRFFENPCYYFRMKTPPHYVLTGGPCAGKTTVILELQKRGYHVLEEAARSVIDEMLAQGKTLDD